MEGNLALFRTLIFAPDDVGADILRFALGDAAVNRDIELSSRLGAVNVLFLEENVHPDFLVAAYCRVSTAQEEQLNSYDVQVRYYTEKTFLRSPSYCPRPRTAHKSA